MYLHFYVYAYLREDGTPYYIGKGKNDRAFTTHRNKRSSFKSPKDKSKIVFLETNLTELGALALERRMIRWYGRKDIGTGILRNLTDGGDGTSGIRKTEEQNKNNRERQIGIPKPKISMKNKISLLGNTNARGNKGKPKSEEHKLKISAANKGKSRSAESNMKQSIAMSGRTQSDETKLKKSNSLIGQRWWSNQDGNSLKSKECPGDGWFLGRSSIRKDI